MFVFWKNRGHHIFFRDLLIFSTYYTVAIYVLHTGINYCHRVMGTYVVGRYLLLSIYIFAYFGKYFENICTGVKYYCRIMGSYVVGRYLFLTLFLPAKGGISLVGIGLSTLNVFAYLGKVLLERNASFLSLSNNRFKIRTNMHS